MIADSLPPQTAAALEVEPKPAADRFFGELSTDMRPAWPASHSGHTLELDLESIERAFGRQVLDERVRAGVEAARTRAEGLALAAGGLTDTLAIAFAADVFVSLAVERPWRSRDVEALLSAVSEWLMTTPEALRVHLFKDALRAPQLSELPPVVALEVQLSILTALSPLLEASLWKRDDTGRPHCVVAAGETATTRRFRTVAAQILDGRLADQAGTILGHAVRRWQTPWAALVVRSSGADAAGSWLAETSEALSPLLERDFLLQRNAARERSLVSASERRLSRLGFDLHDGALQHLAALRSDLQRFGSQVATESHDLAAQVDGMELRVVELDRVLRELAHSLEPASLVRRPLEKVIEAEVSALRARTGIEVLSRTTGDFGAMTPSQKIALIRVVQEAFTNVREHSNASRVTVSLVSSRSCVELQIEDDGDGFEVSRTLQDAAQRGRLGLVGSSERIRLLGGTFDIRSRPGGPTVVSLNLPRWQPVATEQDSPVHGDFLSGLAV